MTDHIAAARQVIRDWCSNEMLPGDYAELTRLIAEAVRAAEARVREECAKECDLAADTLEKQQVSNLACATAKTIAAAIRAGGKR